MEVVAVVVVVVVMVVVVVVVVSAKKLKQLSCVTGGLESPSTADMLYRHTDAQRRIRCRWTSVVQC